MLRSKLFSIEDEKAIVEAIRNGEKQTSGEIRIHLDYSYRGDILKRAQKLFIRLKMSKTKDRNGVLFYIAEKQHKIAVIADKGIHEYVQQAFWDGIIEGIQAAFAANNFATGMIEAIDSTNKQLIQYFPHQGINDKNELPDEISY